ncbi:MAG: DUF5606 domain-containing protein [Cryomorphaceae bacterium]
MAQEQILSVSGKSGLYRLVGQMKNGIIVESIVDGKRFPVHGSAKVSALEEISIYTETEEVALREVFKAIHKKEGGKQTISHKESGDKIKALFEEIIPDYDKERVYASDMAKVVRWYNILIEHDAFDPNDEPSDEEVDSAEGEKKETKPAAKKATKKPAASKAGAKSAPKKPTGGGKVTAPRKAGGTQRGS